jgi:fructosamine-3-kinase
MRFTVKSPPSVMVPACAAGDEEAEMAIVQTPKGFDAQLQSAIPRRKSFG